MIEPLENRIAPAAVYTFFEADGDQVKITSNKGTNAQLAAAMNGNPIQINFDPILDLTTSADFALANITVKVSKKDKDDGNGRVDGITIVAFEGGGANDIDLGKVSVKGNLTALSVGDADLATLAIKTVTATSWGGVENFDTATESRIQGNIGTITVTDFNGYLTSARDFTTAQGTSIAKFTAKNIALNFGEDAGHIQVRAIAKLTVKDTFYGPAGQDLANNGLIEAMEIGAMNIKRMQGGAVIDLSGGLALA